MVDLEIPLEKIGQDGCSKGVFKFDFQVQKPKKMLSNFRPRVGSKRGIFK
ncbi:hypothetical protein HanIR_Chr07g0320901 [Helianthus annuus]|nr:hypothetical protein HanIR_Chr07g0320901 [Helianthus annuus]